MERAPGEYDFSGYRELLEEVKAAGLKLQAVLSFHACGNNVGDTAEIPLPEWVLEAARGASPPFYSDGRGLEPNLEYVSLWADEAEGLLRGRSPLQCYRDFMLAFHRALGPDLGGAVSEVVVGLGPSGELRFPAYSEQVRSPRPFSGRVGGTPGLTRLFFPLFPARLAVSRRGDLPVPRRPREGGLRAGGEGGRPGGLGAAGPARGRRLAPHQRAGGHRVLPGGRRAAPLRLWPLLHGE